MPQSTNYILGPSLLSPRLGQANSCCPKVVVLSAKLVKRKFKSFFKELRFFSLDKLVSWKPVFNNLIFIHIGFVMPIKDQFISIKEKVSFFKQAKCAFFKGPIPTAFSFVLFKFQSKWQIYNLNYNVWKSVDVVLGIQIRGCWLWRHNKCRQTKGKDTWKGNYFGEAVKFKTGDSQFESLPIPLYIFQLIEL